MELAQQKCTTYKAGSPPLTRKETMELLGDVPGWSLTGGHLMKMFEKGDAATSIAFINAVAALGSEEGHFPDFCMKESRYVEVSCYTYPAGGLTKNDFILAAKISAIGQPQ